MKENILIKELETLRTTINHDAKLLGKINPVFKELYNIPFNFTCYEAGFLRTVSWLYMLYYEAGRGEIEYLIEKIKVYDKTGDNNKNSHYKDIRILRTSFQHNFNPENSKYTSYKTITDNWFLKTINSHTPSMDDEWRLSLEKLIDNAKEFLINLDDVVNNIGSDEFKNSIIDDWNYKSLRNFQPHDFDAIIQIVLQEFGMVHFDALKFRKQNFETWSQELKALTGNFDFNVEAKKLIERDILTKPVLPITGSEIIQIFNIQPGLRVKEMIETARKIYLSKPCNREELILKLKEFTDSTK